MFSQILEFQGMTFLLSVLPITFYRKRLSTYLDTVKALTHGPTIKRTITNALSLHKKKIPPLLWVALDILSERNIQETTVVRMTPYMVICIALLAPEIRSNVLWHDGYHSAVIPRNECKVHYSCATCSQVRVCRHTPKGLEEAFRFTCTGENPYCDASTGTCTATPSTDCADTGKLTCLRDGVFPDLENCDEYYICKQGISRRFTCMGDEVFNGKMCVKGDDCVTFDCRNISGAKIPHPNNPAVFAYCLHGRPLFVDRCEDHQKLHPESQMCYVEMKNSTIEDNGNSTSQTTPSPPTTTEAGDEEWW